MRIFHGGKKIRPGDRANHLANDSIRNEICAYCGGKRRLNGDSLSRNLPIQICPICKGTGKVSGLNPYFTRDGYLSIKIADALRLAHGPVKEIYLLDIGNNDLINVELFFEDGKHFKLGGFAVGYSGTRPELFARLVRNAGFYITEDEYVTMHNPGYYFKQNPNSEFILDAGLLWQAKCDGIVRTYSEAVEYCRQLTLANLQHWRLPTLEEYQRLGRQLESEFNGFWTATFESGLADNIAYIDDGTTMFLTNKYYVRAVHEISLPLTWILELVRSQPTENIQAPMTPSIMKADPPSERVNEELNDPQKPLLSESYCEITSPSVSILEDQIEPTTPINIDVPISTNVLQNDCAHQVTQEAQIPPITSHETVESKEKPITKKNKNELSGLGKVLAFLITAILVIILTFVFLPSMPAYLSGNQGDIVDFAGFLGRVSGMICGFSTLIGPITFGIMRAIFPKKTRDSEMGMKVAETDIAVSAPQPEVKGKPSQTGNKIRTIFLILIMLITLFAIIVAVSRFLTANSLTLFPSRDAVSGNSGVVISGCVSASSLRVRTGPGTEFSVVKGLSQGECLSFDGRDTSNGWLRISDNDSLDNSKRQWVSANYIVLKEDISTLPVVTSP